MVLELYLKILLTVLFLADELFAKVLRSLGTCVLVNNALYGELVSTFQLPITFDERFKVTLVPFFIPDFNLLI